MTQRAASFCGDDASVRRLLAEIESVVAAESVTLIVCVPDGESDPGRPIPFAWPALHGHHGRLSLRPGGAGELFVEAEPSVLRHRLLLAAEHARKGGKKLVTCGPVPRRALAKAAPILSHIVSSPRALAHRTSQSGLLACEDYLLDRALDGSRSAREALVTLRLAPIADWPPAKRLRFAETLLMSLTTDDTLEGLAARLNAPIATVKSQRRRLRDVFGEALDDPESRFGMAAALRWVWPLWVTEAELARPSRRRRRARRAAVAAEVPGTPSAAARDGERMADHGDVDAQHEASA